MEIKGISGAELGWAVKLVHEIYEKCVRGQIATQEEVEQFYNYVRAENLWQEMTAGRLLVWGVWEDEVLCGVAGMQSVGHLTMLYVSPECQNRGYGTALLSAMTNYAAQQLHLGQVTVNATPVSSAGFFERKGFARMTGGMGYTGFISLVRPLAGQAAMGYTVYPQQMYGQPKGKPDRVTYPKRSVRGGTVAALVCGLLVIIVAGTVVITLLLG